LRPGTPGVPCGPSTPGIPGSPLIPSSPGGPTTVGTPIPGKPFGPAENQIFSYISDVYIYIYILLDGSYIASTL
jgi:hypothetical protein